MMQRRLYIRNKSVFVLILLISLLLCVDIALGSTLDVYVYYGEKPATQASIYIDNDILLGQTDSTGILKDIIISPDSHIVIAKWQDSYGQERSGMVSFEAQPGSYTMKRIDLQIPRNLGWIWQFVKDING